MLLLAFCPRPISFLVAQKSMSGVVGFFARAFNAIPVARPQDTAQSVCATSRFSNLIQGIGTVSIEKGSTVLRGKGTSFTKDFELVTTSLTNLDFKEKHSITPKGEDPMRIKEIKSDEEIILSFPSSKDIVDQPYKVFSKAFYLLMKRYSSS